MEKNPTDNSKKDDSYLAGRLLLAMPQMEDPRFQRAVIFVCAHDSNGAMGLIINNILPGIAMSELLAQLDIAPNSPPANDPVAAPVMSGGPVESARGFVLHSNDFQQPETIAINPDLCVTGTLDALRAIAAGKGPDKMLFMLGYAGWGAGQLDKEMQDNSWLVADADTAIIFETDPEKKWERAIKQIGIDPSMLSTSAGRA